MGQKSEEKLEWVNNEALYVVGLDAGRNQGNLFVCLLNGITGQDQQLQEIRFIYKNPDLLVEYIKNIEKWLQNNIDLVINKYKISLKSL